MTAADWLHALNPATRPAPALTCGCLATHLCTRHTEAFLHGLARDSTCRICWPRYNDCRCTQDHS